MSIRHLALVLAALLSVAPAQYLETSIMLPDSLSDLQVPQCFTFNSVSNTVFVGGTGPVALVLDGATGRKLTQVRIGWNADMLCHNPTSNKVYGAKLRRICVIDGATNTLLADISCEGAPPTSMCHNPVNNRFYCTLGGTLKVIDGVTDQLRATLELPAAVRAIACSPVTGRVYCALPESSSVALITGDSITGQVRTPEGPDALCYNPANNCVYVAHWGAPSLTVLDGVGDSVLTTIPLPVPARRLICSPLSNKVYCGGDASDDVPTLTVVDGATHRVIDSVRVGPRPIPAWDSTRNRLLVLSNRLCTLRVIECSDDRVLLSRPVRSALALCFAGFSRRLFSADENRHITIRDADSLAVVNDLSPRFRPLALCASPDGATTFCASYEEVGRLAVVNAADNRVDTVLAVGNRPLHLLYNPREDKVYVGNSRSASVTVIDARRRRVIAELPVGSHPGPFCCDPVGNRVYCAIDDLGIAVISGENEAVLDTIELGFDVYALAFNPLRNKLYAGGSHGGVAVIDAVTNELITRIAAGRSTEALCYNPANDLVYAAHAPGYISVIDGAADILLRTVPGVPAPVKLQLHPDGSRLYCVCATENALLAVIDCALDTTIAFLPLGAIGDEFMGLSCDSLHNRIFVSGIWDSGTTTVIDISTNSVVGVIPTGFEPFCAVSSSPLGRTYVADYQQSLLWVIRCDGLGTPAPSVAPARACLLEVEPNPCSGILTLRAPVTGTLRVSDPTGRERCRFAPGTRRLDLTALSDGIYFLAGGRSKAKVVLRR